MNAAIVIPTHNEARVIGATVASCRRVAPGTPVFVIADRCNDDSASVALAAGAWVRERPNGASGKGAALSWFVGVAGDELAAFDTIVVIDADSRLRPGAVEALAGKLNSDDVTAVQGFVHPLPDTASPGAMLAAYSEWISQQLDDRLRKALGWPVRLRGTGMAMKTAIFLRFAPLLRTQIEDAELTLLLAASGLKTAFVPEAVVEDPKPSEFARLVGQRARWLQGQREIWRYRRAEILRLALAGGPRAWSLLSALLLKPQTLFMASKLIIVLALGMLPPSWPATVARLVIGLSLALDGLRLLVGLVLVPAAWRSPIVRALFYSPLFLAVWVRSILASLNSRDGWFRARD